MVTFGKKVLTGNAATIQHKKLNYNHARKNKSK